MLKQLIGVLLVVQALAFAHMLYLMGEEPVGAIAAIPGGITQLTIYPIVPWGGVWGSLSNSGSTLLSVTEHQISSAFVYYNDSDNNCSVTEVFASTSPVSATSITPIDPVQADAILGLKSTNPYSTAQMFIEQHEFDIAGSPVVLWSTQTNGNLGPYWQGIAQSAGQLVFVTSSRRNAQNYAGQYAQYQFILPAGDWRVTFDSADTCSVLSEYSQTESSLATYRLDVAMNPRICVNQETELHSVRVADRSFCRPDEIGRAFCTAISGAQMRVYHGDEVLDQGTSGESGEFLFTPLATTQHSIIVSTQNETVRKYFTPGICLERGTILGESELREYDRVFLDATPDRTADPRDEAPADIATSIKTDFIVISWLTIVILALSLLSFYRQHKNDSPILLKMRIKMLEMRK